MVVFVVKRYAVCEAKKWRYAVRNAKIERYAVRKGEGVSPSIIVYQSQEQLLCELEHRACHRMRRMFSSGALTQDKIVFNVLQNTQVCKFTFRKVFILSFTALAFVTCYIQVRKTKTDFYRSGVIIL